MPWSVVGAVGASVAGAAISSAMAPDPSSGASGAAAAADPFASQRGQYQTMLSQLISNPSSISSDPGYQFGMQQGLNAVNGAMASGGYLNSGNRLTALQQQGMDFANTQLTNKELFLAQLAGANVGSPGTAGQILQGQNMANQQAAGVLGNAIGQGVSQLAQQGFNGFNSGGSGAYDFSMPSGYDSSGYGFGGGFGGGNGSNAYGFSTGVSNDFSSSYIPGTYGV